MKVIVALISWFLSSYVYCTSSEYLYIGRDVRTCSLVKSSKNYRKTQINIEICDFFQSPKVCIGGGGGWGGGGGSDNMSPTAESGGYA